MAPEEQTFIGKLSALLDVHRINELYQLLNSSIYHIERNVNTRALLMDLSIQVHHRLRKK